MKVKDIPVYKQKVLDSLPILQADVTKILGIDHRDVSLLIGIMVKENLVKKKRTDRTFLIEKYNDNGNDQKKKEKNFNILLSNDKFSPCCGCGLECDPVNCIKLDEWIKHDLDKTTKEIKIKNEKS